MFNFQLSIAQNMHSGVRFPLSHFNFVPLFISPDRKRWYLLLPFDYILQSGYVIEHVEDDLFMTSYGSETLVFDFKFAQLVREPSDEERDLYEINCGFDDEPEYDAITAHERYLIAYNQKLESHA